MLTDRNNKYMNRNPSFEQISSAKPPEPSIQVESSRSKAESWSRSRILNDQAQVHKGQGWRQRL